MFKRLREWVASVLAANFTTTATGAANIGLGFNIGANETWVVDVQLTAQCSGTGGVAYAVTAPAGATIEGWVYSSTSAIATLLYQRIVALATLTSTALHTVATIPAPDVLRFTIINGSTAGSVQLQAASKTNGQITTIFKGSGMTAWRAA